MSERTHCFDNPQNLKRLLRVLYVICAGLFLIDLLVQRYVTYDWESFPGFHAFYGFIACVLLVLVAKQLRRIVMRDESYYENE